MRLTELTARAGVAERQVRYLISEGFVSPPRGGRAHADYGEDHVQAILRYQRLKDLGFPPAAIKLLLKADAGAPVPVAPGLTLLVSPELMASGQKVGPLLQSLETILASILKGPDHEPEHTDQTD